MKYKMINKEVKTFKEVPVCAKCEIPLLVIESSIYMSDPPKAEFVCTSCGEKIILSQPDWGELIYEYVESNQ